MFRRALAPVALIWLVLGCTATRPPGNLGFVDVQTLHALEGIYANIGEGGEGAPVVYLSELIWPDGEGIGHRYVDAIEVRATGESTLLVRALASGSTVKEQTFTEGVDFDFAAGRLRVKAGPRAVGTESGEAVLGIETRSVELGIDVGGHGKLKASSSAFGLAYMIVPVATGVSHEIRFVRLGS